MPGGSLISRLYDFVNGLQVQDYHLDNELDRIHEWINGKIGNINIAPDAGIDVSKLNGVYSKTEVNTLIADAALGHTPDGSIDAVKLNFDPATQADLAAFLPINGSVPMTGPIAMNAAQNATFWCHVNDLHIDTTVGTLWLESRGNLSLAQNAYYDHVSGWMRFDTTKPAWAISMLETGPAGPIVRYAAAGANPIVWTAYTMPLPTGVVQTNLNADRVDSFHFRLNGQILEYSSDGAVWAPAGLPSNKIRAICRRT